MADGLNKVQLLGNLGADPELRMTAGGSAVLKMRIATSSSFLNKDQVREERTEWHSVTLWGKRGEALSKFLTKGDRIFVEGELRTSSYEKNGEKRYSTEINALNVILCGGKKEGVGESSGGGGGGGYERRPAPAASKPADDFGDYSSGAGAGDDEIPF